MKQEIGGEGERKDLVGDRRPSERNRRGFDGDHESKGESSGQNKVKVHLRDRVRGIITKGARARGGAEAAEAELRASQLKLSDGGVVRVERAQRRSIYHLQKQIH